jgi:hypothetical protein
VKGKFQDGKAPFQVIKEWIDGWERLKLVKNKEETT